MRRIVTLLVIFSIFYFSCSTDFSVTTSWKDVTILYGLLDASDTAQYMKINKAFLDPTTSALTIAQNPDSLYYQSLNVVLEEYQNGNLLNTLQLEKVDGNSEGYVKDTGIFASGPNFLYKTKQPLNQNSSYKIVITNESTGKVVSSSTEIINDFKILRPSIGQSVSFIPGSVYNVNWQSAQDGKTYALTIRFHYTEAPLSDPSNKQDKYIDWIIFSDYVGESTEGGSALPPFPIQSNDFYSKLLNVIPIDPTLIREAGKLDFIFAVGGLELYTFNQVTQAQQGLTSGQIEPQFTNVDNGIGLFSSRFHKTLYDISLDGKTIDSLACSPNTRDLHFKNSQGFTCF